MGSVKKEVKSIKSPTPVEIIVISANVVLHVCSVVLDSM